MPVQSQSRDELRQRVRRYVERGRLPMVVPKQVAAGYGSGRICAACDEPIARTQVEYEVDDCPDRVQLRFHAHCHSLWQLECARRRN
jgi:hypothetical protein